MTRAEELRALAERVEAHAIADKQNREPVPDTCWGEVGYGRAVRVVLTVAHLDHQPENCADDNLRAWCQRCHNVYDAPMRRAGIAERARAEKAERDLFTEEPR